MPRAADFDPDALPIISLVDEGQVDTLHAAMAARGWTVWRLDSTGAVDAAGVFAQAGRDLPPPFPHRPVSDWTQFADSLWEAVHTSDGDVFALLWTGADRLLHGALADLIWGVLALAQLSRSLARPAAAATPKTFRSVLAGAGPNFPPLPGS